MSFAVTDKRDALAVTIIKFRSVITSKTIQQLFFSRLDLMPVIVMIRGKKTKQENCFCADSKSSTSEILIRFCCRDPANPDINIPTLLCSAL